MEAHEVTCFKNSLSVHLLTLNFLKHRIVTRCHAQKRRR